jgi:two-component system response regulator AtoC
MNTRTILIVDDDDRLRQSLGILVNSLGYHEITAADARSAQEVLATRHVDLVISDLRMPGLSGLDLLEIIKRTMPGTPVIMLTAYGTIETAVDAMHKGAFDYVTKPFDARELESHIERALSMRRYQAENEYLRRELDERGAFGEMIGVSDALARVVEVVKQVATAKTSVLLVGETGTGKELVARAIHRRSPRHDGLMVPVNLAAVPTELLESELFGHTRGAFTGATSNHAGKFEVAHGGTLLLDEIADAPLLLQPKLLRVLQDGVVTRIGSNESQEVDVRVIAATNRDLTAEVEAGRFRADLYYRLRVVEIQLPPLRERREDIRYLAAHFLRKFGREREGGSPQITEGALRRLEEYRWPGNVRELENVIERAVVLAGGDTIDVDLLDLRDRITPAANPGTGLRLDRALESLEREMIVRALGETNDIKARAARHLGVSERTLWYKLRKHRLS